MIGKVKEINKNNVVIEFINGSTKLISFDFLPDSIIIDDLINLDYLDSMFNEKYVDYF